MSELVRHGDDGWYAVPAVGASADLVDALAVGRSWPDGLRGSWTGEAPPLDRTERPVEVDQTQYSVVVGESVVVKWTVTPTETVSPAPVLTAHLAALGFSAQPTPLGDLRTANGILLAAVTGYLPGAQDGWDWYVDDVRAHADGATVDVLTPASDLGRLTADLHLALATPSEHIGAPRQVATRTTVDRWRRRALASLDEALGVTAGPEGERLTALAAKARAVLERLGRIDTTPVQPVHGDLHVGQILRWPGGYAVNDFDGNPVLPADERLAAQPTARDVAGLLQSLDHVGRVALRSSPGADPALVEPRLVKAWIPMAQNRFLEAYRLALAEHDASSLFDERLLAPFAVEQECREYVYAARHLPRWLYVPDAAMPALLA